MRIAHVIDHFQPWLGYQEVQVPRAQVSLGHEVCVFASNRYIRNAVEKGRSRIIPYGRTEFDGVDVVRLPVYFETPTEAGYMIMRGLGTQLQSFAPDVVHCHNLLSLTAVHCALLRPRIGYTLVVDSHAADFNTFGPRESKARIALKRLLYRAFLIGPGRIVFRQANAIVTIGESELAFLRSLIALRANGIEVIRLGADSTKFSRDAAARECVRARMGWNPDEMVCVHAGTLRPGKRVDMLIEACRKLRSEGLPVRVHLIGRIDALYKVELEQMIRDYSLDGNVTLSPFATQDELNEWFSAADIGVWPGDPSVAVLEAMSSGLPVVAKRTPYTEAIIQKWEAGTLIDSGTSEALAEAIRSLVTNDDKRAEQRTNARKAIEQELNWNAIAEQFVELYKRAAPLRFDRT